MRPVKFTGLAELAGQVLTQIVGDAVIVEQRIVDIEKKDDIVGHDGLRSEIRLEASAVRTAPIVRQERERLAPIVPPAR